MSKPNQAELNRIADEAQAAYEAADQAVIEAHRLGAKMAEIRALRAARDAAEEAFGLAADARDANPDMTMAPLNI